LAPIVTDMTTLDDLDRGLLHALQLDARAPFTTLARVLGTSPQTVLRRYHRLRERAGLRVAGLADPSRARRQQWIVRISTTPRAAHQVAVALARRADTAWVQLTSGGTEIVAIVQGGTGSDGAGEHALLLRDIPRIAGINAMSAHYLLHLYRGGPSAWHGRVAALTAAQQRMLRSPTPDAAPAEVTLSAADDRLFGLLNRDGRASYADLAAATGWSASTVTRRLDELRRGGVLFFDVEVDNTLLGIHASAMLWMSVPPALLDQVARGLAEHPELAVVAATTGRTNLLATVLSPDPAALHHYLTTRLAIPAISAIETAPILRTVKGVAPPLP
jgi:DNA-binding Lrp family transcriptional regulator